MTTQLLATELANLIQESKRKNNDLRQAAEKSLEELKGLGNVSEQAAPDLLSQKANFVNPFIIACGTKNAKFTSIAIVCLQRLIVAKALPKSKLNQALEALMQASSAGLDVQLKILQALPSLLQNYSSELRGDLLVTALNICFILQSSKNAIVNNTSAATLQQLVVSVFDKVVAEDKNATDVAIVGEVATANGKIGLRSAAMDAYRIFNDLCLLTENQRPEFLRFSGLPQTFGLELVESVITNHASVFTTHPEQAHVIRIRVMPLIMSGLKARPTFATTVRLVRILYTLLRRHLTILPSECGAAIDTLTHLLDQDSTIWKRALCMEVFRGIFAEHALIRRMFALFDANENEKDILKNLTATFVRLSTEKPAVIGLGLQSTLPVSNMPNTPGGGNDHVMLEPSGVTGIISTPGGSESSIVGISTLWSSVRVPCIDQLDKVEPPYIPESYVYSLVLSCVSSLSDGLAKFILPLTVPGDSRPRRKVSKNEAGRDSPAPAQVDAETESTRSGLERSASFKKNPVPLNPLSLEDHPMYSEIKICSAIVDECWPAILATCSTFLNAALDSEYFHSLVRAFQRFAHVAGLLQLSTPRDAFLTTLGKAAVPPNVLTACLNSGQSRPSTATTPVETPNTLLGNARGLLSPDSRTPTSPSVDKQRQQSFDAAFATLNTRNLLCLRALLNLGIALGPTLDSAWRIILETLQQADFVLYSTGKKPNRTPSFSRGQDPPPDNEGSLLMANFSNEVRSVETAASRLIESTIDFPNAAFVEVVKAICALLGQQPSDQESTEKLRAPETPTRPPRATSGQHRRVVSFSNQISSSSTQEDQFALAKLGDIATINIERLLMDAPDVSGWDPLVGELIKTLVSPAMAAAVRTRAADILSKLMLEAAGAAASVPDETRRPIQLRLLQAIRDALIPLKRDDRVSSVTAQSNDVDIHRILLDGLKSIIEECGESLVSGWDVTFEIIGSIFIKRDFDLEERRGSGPNPNLLASRSSRLIRSSFNSLQLICSDFLASLPNSCFLSLVDTLYKFSSQDDDLNIALTTVTFFWALSDFLSRKNESLQVHADLVQDAEESDLVVIAADPEREGSDAALWMLLLLRLTAVTSDDRLELRNSAIQTLLRIFDAYGERLSPEAWSTCIRRVVFRLLASLEEELEAAQQEDADETDLAEWTGTAVVVLSGISSLLANYLDVLAGHPSFNQLWRELLGHFASLLDFKVLDINTATFKALGHVLSQRSDDERHVFNQSTVDFAWDLWSRGVPVSQESSNQDTDNQQCLLAYVAALHEVYCLIREDLTVDRVQRILELLRETVEAAMSGGYVGDVEILTPLQSKGLESIRMIRTDVAGVPSAVIKQVSDFVTLAYDQEKASKSNPKRTFVAMSKASTQMLEKLILEHSSDKDIYQSGAVSKALSALCRSVSLKYGFSISTRSAQPWRLSTSSTLSILGAALPQLKSLNISTSVSQEIWCVVVAVADGILSADCNVAAAGTNFGDDEEFDVAAFHQLRKLIIPSLGQDSIPEKTRTAYAESLFKTSIIHDPAPSDKAIIFGRQDGSFAAISALYKPRVGRTLTILPTTRVQMSYVALDELFCLMSSEPPVDPDETLNTSSASTSQAAQPDKQTALRARMARNAAPFFLLRCALSLRGFIADQPLRGKMPQPLSRRKELLWILNRLVRLKSEEGAIPNLGGVESESRKHLLMLYPLLVKALSVDGGDKVSHVLREALEVVGGELGL